MNEHPFVDDWNLMFEINELRKEFNIQTIIETGTWKGHTAFILSSLFDKVITIEIEKDFFEEAKFLDSRHNVTRILGDSVKELDKVLLHMQQDKPIMIFLDAHSFGHGCPLRDELDVLIKHRRRDTVIVLHDCKVPDNDILKYDEYEEIPISFEYIKDKLDELYGEYSYYFNNECTGEQQVGVMFVMPIIREGR